MRATVGVVLALLLGLLLPAAAQADVPKPKMTKAIAVQAMQLCWDEIHLQGKSPSVCPRSKFVRSVSHDGAGHPFVLRRRVSYWGHCERIDMFTLACKETTTYRFDRNRVVWRNFYGGKPPNYVVVRRFVVSWTNLLPNEQVWFPGFVDVEVLTSEAFPTPADGFPD